MTALRSLRHRDFRLFWFGQMLSTPGTWMHSVGQAWLVLELTGSPVKLGLVAALQWLPMLLFSLPAGALVDRVPRRRVLLLTQFCQMALAFGLALLVWSGSAEYWHVAVLAFVGGLVHTLDAPARQSFLSMLVPAEDLINAVALNSAVFNGARIVGPAVAGVVIAKAGVLPTFLVNGVSFLAVLVALACIRTEGVGAARPSSLLADIREGLAFASGTPRISLPLSLLFVVSVFLMNHNVMVPLLARDGLRLGPEGFGGLMAALGVGAVLAAGVLAQTGRGRPSFPALVVPALGVGVVTFCVGFASDFSTAAGLLALGGFSQLLFTARCNTSLQLSSPEALRGRVMSLYTMVFAGVAPLGALLSGWLVENAGASRTYEILGFLGLCLLVALSGRALQGIRLQRALRMRS